MGDVLRYFRLLLLALALLHLGLVAREVTAEVWGATGLVEADGVSPLGGDFINLLTVAELVGQGRIADIYAPANFAAAQRTIIPQNIGLRLWAYPPHSLFIAWPFQALGFWAAFIVWSALGLAILAWGARRIGFGWLETAIVVLSPAAVSSVYYGQTGNLAAGALLLALSARRRTDVVSVVAAALLTIKPQTALLLPVQWLIRRRFSLIGWTVLATLALLAAAVAAFGLDAWRGYFNETLPVLNLLEREGSGSFLFMVPLAFMAERLLTQNAIEAGAIHWTLAAVVGAVALWRLYRSTDPGRQAAIVLTGTALITPYIHIYDLAPLVVAALLVSRLWAVAPRAGQLGVFFVLLAVWALPDFVVLTNMAGLPVTALVMLALFALSVCPVPAVAPRSEPDAVSLKI